MIFGYVPPPVDWGRVEALLLPAIERGGEVGPADVLARLNDGTAQLWCAVEGPHVVMALVTERAGDALHLWLIGGSGRRDWLHFLDVVKDAAREGGMTRLTLKGRPGWARILKGWQANGDGLEFRL